MPPFRLPFRDAVFLQPDVSGFQVQEHGGIVGDLDGSRIEVEVQHSGIVPFGADTDIVAVAAILGTVGDLHFGQFHRVAQVVIRLDELARSSSGLDGMDSSLYALVPTVCFPILY